MNRDLGVDKAIDRRHSVRAFLPDPLAEDEITALLEAARRAPSSLNSQPWRFKVVTDPEDLAWFGTKEASRKQAWLAKAPAIVVCCADLAGYVKDSQANVFFLKESKMVDGEPLKGIETYVSKAESDSEMARFGASAMNVAIAVSFMMLRAVELGLGTCWLGMFDEAAIKARLGIPESLRLVCLLAVGRPREAQAPPRRRKDLDEIVLK